MENSHRASSQRYLGNSVVSRVESILHALRLPSTAMASKTLLLKNGVVVVHDANDHAKAVKADLFIKGNKIVKLSPNIEISAGAQVIDCTDKIIAPGFIDTHRHMYTIGLRGRHGDNLLADYLVQGEVSSMGL